MFYPTKTEYNVKMWTDKNKTEQIGVTSDGKDVYLEDGTTVEELLVDDMFTPTVTHETTNFKVGVGDSDISQNIVDGDMVKMTIKGQTYQNILPEPSLRNSMENGKSMQKFNNGYDSVNVVDGVGKSAILKGQTLVNISNRHNATAFKNGKTFDTASATNRSLYLCKTGEASKLGLSPNTKYLVQFEISNLNLDGKSNITLIFSDSTIASGNCLFGQTTQTPISSNGVYRKVLTTTELIDTSSLVVKGGSDEWENSGSTSRTLTVSNIMLIPYQEGMENWDIPYFEGMTSCKMPVLCTTGKNLFDKSKVKYNTTIISGNGQEEANNLYMSSDFISVKPNETYTSNKMGVIFYYDKDKQYVGELNNGGDLPKTFTTPINCKYIRVRCWAQHSEVEKQKEVVESEQLEQGSTATSYEPYKSNILTVNEDVTLRGIGDVKDELDVTTGKLTQRIGEIKLGNFDAISYSSTIFEGYYTAVLGINNKASTSLIMSNLVPTRNFNNSLDCGIYNNPTNIVLFKKGATLEEVKNLVSNLIVQYQLAEKSVKTVDLSSFGNWNKVTLNGSESYSIHNQNSDSYIRFRIPLPSNAKNSNTTSSIDYGNVIWCDSFAMNRNSIDGTTPTYEYCSTGTAIGYDNTPVGYISILKSKLATQDVDGFKQYLQSNPVTVWYQTTTSQANSIKEMLSFANGHIQLSSGADNSLIPSIDYEVPTSNSYHMDLLKTSTVYTMKADSASGTCSLGKYPAIDLLTNKIFSISTGYEGDKLLVVSGSWTNPMIIEGDVTAKTLTYFKGIKSAFEDKGKIEVLLVGKNLFRDNNIMQGTSSSVIGTTWEQVGGLNTPIENQNQTRVKMIKHIEIKPDTWYQLSNNGGLLYSIKQFDKDGIGVVDYAWSESSHKFKSASTAHKLILMFKKSDDVNITPDEVEKANIMIEEGQSITSYEPYKSNDVKIPLLKPSRSILGGVYDEIILDRENNKAKVIQRVGKIILNGGQEYIYESAYQRFYTPLNTLKKQKYYISSLLSDKGEILNHYTGLLDDYTGAIGITGYPDSANNYPNSNWLYFKVKNITTISELKQYLSLNPITVYYELATPIVTEVDIEGFPYIYKDGHIIINSTDITPTIEIGYNINQSQQIKSCNETLIRHEKDIMQLDELISLYVNELYISTKQGLNRDIIFQDLKTLENRE